VEILTGILPAEVDVKEAYEDYLVGKYGE
jgi:hypothetical protein